MVNSFGSCRTDVLQWKEVSKKFELSYSLRDAGNVQQWTILQSDKDSVRIKIFKFLKVDHNLTTKSLLIIFLLK